MIRHKESGNDISSFYTSLLVVVGISFGVTLFVFFRPLAHWDIIPYVASALSEQGLSGQELHKKTYEIIRNAYDPATFSVLIGSPGDAGHGAYRHTIYSDPEALAQQLPFYRIRVGYIFLVNALAPLVGNLVDAAQILSAVCAGLLTMVAGGLLLRSDRALKLVPSLFFLPLIVAAAGGVTVGRAETPDALAALIGLLVLSLLHSHRLFALCLIALLPLFRTDGIILAGLTFILLLAERDRKPVHYVLIFAAFVLYIFVNQYAGNYGHLVLFNFTLLHGAPDPYPESMNVATDILVYIKFYFFALIKFSPTLLYLALVLLVAAVDAGRWKTVNPFAARGMIAVFFVILHFLLFPLGSDRHYVFALIFASVYAVQTLFLWWSRAERRARLHDQTS